VAKLFVGVSLVSLKPKSASVNVWPTPPGTLRFLFAPLGASLTANTVMVAVFGVGSVLDPPLVPSSFTWNVKLA